MNNIVENNETDTMPNLGSKTTVPLIAVWFIGLVIIPAIASGSWWAASMLNEIRTSTRETNWKIERAWTIDEMKDFRWELKEGNPELHVPPVERRLR